jgi:hypothetical protein
MKIKYKLKYFIKIITHNSLHKTHSILQMIPKITKVVVFVILQKNPHLHIVKLIIVQLVSFVALIFQTLGVDEHGSIRNILTIIPRTSKPHTNEARNNKVYSNICICVNTITQMLVPTTAHVNAKLASFGTTSNSINITLSQRSITLITIHFERI